MDGGKTPLRWAVFKENVQVVRFLLERGADASARDDFGL
jgi:ankyrin repeat protein